MPNINEVSANAKKLKEQISQQSGVAKKDISDSNLQEADKILAGAAKVSAAGDDPTKIPAAQLKQAGTGGEADSSSAKDLSNQQKIAMTIAAIAPILVGYAAGGDEGGAIGGKVAADGITAYGKSIDETNKIAAASKEKKELKASELSQKSEENEKDRQLKRELAEIAAGKDKNKVSLTKGQEAVDKNFAKEYDSFVVGGGYADVQKGLKQLKEASTKLDNMDSASGPLIGKAPRWVRGVVASEGLDLQEGVEEVVQRNLRLVLGPQFTAEEGKSLIARAYNPQLDEKTNAKRVNRLIKSIEQAAEAKLAAADYYEEHGTLKGYKGTALVSKAAIENAIDADEDETKTAGVKNPALPAAQAVEMPDFANMDEKDLEAYVGGKPPKKKKE